MNVSFADMPDYLPLRGGREPKAGQPSLIALPIPKPYGSRNLSKLKINECFASHGGGIHRVACQFEWVLDLG